MRLGKAEIAALIPHAGSMCLLDRVLEWNEAHIVAASDTHRDPGHPLRRGARLAALHLCEYGAQAMAVHGGLLAQAAGGRARPGLLVALREIELEVASLESLAGELVIEASRLLAGPDSWQYAFTAHHAGAPLARGRAAIKYRPA